MGLGGTAKKVQKLADRADDLYQRVQRLHEQLSETRETVDDTNERVATLEVELAEQRALVTALAEAQGIDVDAVTEGAGDDVEPPDADVEAESA